MKAGTKVKAAAAAGLFVYFAGHGHAGHGHNGLLDSLRSLPISVPSGGYSQASWARAFLHSGGFPDTGCNRGFVISWENAEGGNWANSARYNPLDTTEREPGSHAMNSVGVQAYQSWKQGMQATVTTIRNGRYGGIIAALDSGNNAQAAAGAVASSPWGTGAFTAQCA